jgi:hypothetical protein
MISFQDKICIRPKNVRLDICNYNNLLIFEIRMFVSDFALGRWFPPARYNWKQP